MQFLLEYDSGVWLIDGRLQDQQDAFQLFKEDIVKLQDIITDGTLIHWVLTL